MPSAADDQILRWRLPGIEEVDQGLARLPQVPVRVDDRRAVGAWRDGQASQIKNDVAFGCPYISRRFRYRFAPPSTSRRYGSTENSVSVIGRPVTAMLCRTWLILAGLCCDTGVIA